MWFVYFDVRRHITVQTDDGRVLSVYDRSLLEQKFGAPHDTPRDACLEAIEHFKAVAAEHSKHTIDCYKLNQETGGDNHAIVWVNALLMHRAISTFVHVFDAGLHGKKWPKPDAA